MQWGLLCVYLCPLTRCLNFCCHFCIVIFAALVFASRFICGGRNNSRSVTLRERLYMDPNMMLLLLRHPARPFYIASSCVLAFRFFMHYILEPAIRYLCESFVTTLLRWFVHMVVSVLLSLRALSFAVDVVHVSLQPLLLLLRCFTHG